MVTVICDRFFHPQVSPRDLCSPWSLVCSASWFHLEGDSPAAVNHSCGMSPIY